MISSVVQNRRFAGLFPENSEIAILDGCQATPAWSIVYFRDWAADGVVVSPQGGAESDVPLVVVVPQTGPSDSIRSILSQLPIHREFRLVAAESNSFAYHGRLLTAPPPRLTRFDLTLTGRKQLTLQNLNGLPTTVWATLPAYPAHRVIHLEGGPSAASLPEPAWMSIDDTVPNASTELQIDVDPVGNRWVIRHSGRSVGWQLPSRPMPSTVQRLYVVFDRTCPDANRWAEARQLVRGHTQLGGDRLGGLTHAVAPSPSLSAPDPDYQAKLNAEIRRGLADGLKSAFSTEVEVHFSWFADTAGTGLGCPDGVNLPESVCGWAETTAGSNSLWPLIESATYTPGLDLWDALDEALAEVVATARRYGPGPVLIVGNSPPRPPKNPHHPFTLLWRFELPRSAVRKRGRVDETLAALDALGCPVATVYPTGHLEASAEYRTRQGKVRQAFERVTEVFSGNATAEGIAQQVRAACLRLCGWVSGAELRSGED